MRIDISNISDYTTSSFLNCANKAITEIDLRNTNITTLDCTGNFYTLNTIYLPSHTVAILNDIDSRVEIIENKSEKILFTRNEILDMYNYFNKMNAMKLINNETCISFKEYLDTHTT